MSFQCIGCSRTYSTPVRYPCANCGFSLDHLDGTSRSFFQQRKWGEHTELVTGSAVSLGTKEWNCSFDTIGFSQVTDLVSFTLNYGDKLQLPSSRGRHINDVYVSFIPEIIGSGTSVHYTILGTQACSGCCVISPQSINYGHPFPILHDWVNAKFTATKKTCRSCSNETHLGLTFCWDCYTKAGNDWRKFL